MKKRKFISPKIKTEEILLNLFSRYGIDSSIDGFLMNEVYAGSYSTYLPIIISDKRLKTDVQSLRGGLERVMQLAPVRYKWKKTDTSVLGLLAQDVKKVLPEAVVEKSGLNMVDYAGVIALLVTAVQEQQREIDSLKQIILDRNQSEL